MGRTEARHVFPGPGGHARTGRDSAARPAGRGHLRTLVAVLLAVALALWTMTSATASGDPAHRIVANELLAGAQEQLSAWEANVWPQLVARGDSAGREAAVWADVGRRHVQEWWATWFGFWSMADKR